MKNELAHAQKMMRNRNKSNIPTIPSWMIPLFPKSAFKEKPSPRVRKPKTGTAEERRKAREASGDFTKEQWLEIKERYGRCLRCGSTSELLVPDHVTPMFRGGAHSASNIQPLCRRCNIWKGLKIIDFR